MTSSVESHQGSMEANIRKLISLSEPVRRGLGGAAPYLDTGGGRRSPQPGKKEMEVSAGREKMMGGVAESSEK